MYRKQWHVISTFPDGQHKVGNWMVSNMKQQETIKILGSRLGFYFTAPYCISSRSEAGARAIRKCGVSIWTMHLQQLCVWEFSERGGTQWGRRGDVTDPGVATCDIPQVPVGHGGHVEPDQHAHLHLTKHRHMVVDVDVCNQGCLNIEGFEHRT